MSGRRAVVANTKAGFKKSSNVDDSSNNIHPSILKQSRKSGQLNLSGRNLVEVPESVWRINLDGGKADEAVTWGGGGGGGGGGDDDRWWEQVDLTKLILASNLLTALSSDLALLAALTVLDVHDNQLTSLPTAIGQLTQLQRLMAGHNELTELPGSIGNLENLSVLHLEHNKLVDLREDVCRLGRLEDLDISHNKLTSLPKGLDFLSKLLKFNVANNSLQVLPHQIGCMLGLRTLDATHNALHSIPDELGLLSHLEILYLRHNRLTHLPLLRSCSALKELHLGNNAIRELTDDHIDCLTSVCVLDLRDNRLSSLSERVSTLTALQRLDLSNNDLATLPCSLGLLTNLKHIVVDGNPMKGIRRDIIMRGTNELKKYLASRIGDTSPSSPPSAVRQTTGTSGIVGGVGNGVDPHTISSSKTLDYSDRKVTSVPDDLWSLAISGEVTEVNVSKNYLTEWPASLSSLSKSLLYVYIQCNKLQEIPSTVADLTKLMFIDISTNWLISLPAQLASLQHLRELNIAFNRLQELPACIAALKSLEILVANDNKIASVDASSVQALSALATLDLRNNSITQLPPQLGLCTQLRSLQLEGNLFRQPRPAVLTKGTVFLLQYLRDRLPTD